MDIVEKQVWSVWKIHDMMEEVLERMQEGRDACCPTVCWGLTPPDGEEPQG
jgi:hypothetical protein